MSLYSALRSGVSGLFAQTQAMSMISDNITNVNTTGYKAVRARFASLVGGSDQAEFNSGVVNAVADRAVTKGGQVTASNVNTHLAVNGNGFFAVTKASDVFLDPVSGDWKVDGEILYTRAGDFSPDENGNLRNSSGYVLLGWQRNSSNSGYDATNLLSEFTAINVAGAVGQPIPTQNTNLNANLNANADIDDVFTMTAPMYSRQGGISNIEYRFTKTDNPDKTEFMVQARVTTGSAQIVNEQNPPVAGTNSAGDDIHFYGVTLGADPREVVLNYSETVSINEDDVRNLRVQYTNAAGIEVDISSTNVVAEGGKVTVTLGSAIPDEATNFVIAVGPDSTGAALTSPIQTTGTTPTALTIPATGTVDAEGTLTGTNFSGYYEIGLLAFDSSGQNPQLQPYQSLDATAPFYRDPADGSFVVGRGNEEGALVLAIDHSANGSEGRAPDGTDYAADDTGISVTFSQQGASAGMTSYVSPSTIYSIDQDGNGTGELQSVTFNARGELEAIFSRGSPQFLAQVPLINFNNPNALLVKDGNTYKADDAAGVAVSRVAGTGDTGTIAGGSLESSNADIATEFTEMIVVQRAYSASTKIITTVDEMLDEVIRAKR